ncbi:MAG: ATP-binding protein, partial [Pseudomonadota bacterium]
VEIVQVPAASLRQSQPTIQRKPEIIHGLRNLVQNAVDFADDEVVVEMHWNDDTVSVRIMDDGPGYSVQILGRLGDPFTRLRTRAQTQIARPEYEGMGLGLFIAKTLLERSGAQLRFANGADGSGQDTMPGAVVEVTWPRDKMEADATSQHQPIGANQKIAT